MGLVPVLDGGSRACARRRSRRRLRFSGLDVSAYCRTARSSAVLIAGCQMSIRSTFSRRQLFTGRFRTEPAAIRPPWTSEESISSHCERCGLCAKACSEGIIHIGEDGFPTIRFAAGECTFCYACAEACPAPVFAPRDTAPWHLRPAVGDRCFTAHGIYCRSCGDACPERAIQFRAALGGRAEITIDLAACTGCGACVSVCPRNAVEMLAVPGAQETAHG